MDEIFEICDQISVLRDGSLVMTKDSKDTDMNELISAMVGRSLDNRFPPVDNKPGEVIFSVENLSTKYAPKLQNISFDIRKGEIFGLYGLVGAGRTELLETIFGMRTRAAGNVIYDGKMLEPKGVPGFEFSHTIIQKNGILCNCGKRGCFRGCRGLYETSV